MKNQTSLNHSSDTSPDLTPATAPQVANCLKIMLGCYRTVEAHDPDTFTAALLKAMSAYPLDVLMAAIDPASGLPAKCKWVPQPSEIIEFCEAKMVPRWRQAERLRQRAVQVAARAEQQDGGPRKSAEQMAAEMAEFRAKMGLSRKVPNASEIAAELMARHGLTQEQWDAIEEPKLRGWRELSNVGAPA